MTNQKNHQIQEAMKIPDNMKRSMGELAPVMGALVDVGRDIADAFGAMPIEVFDDLRGRGLGVNETLVLMTAGLETFADKFDTLFGKKVLALMTLLDDPNTRKTIEKFYEEMIKEELPEPIEIPFIGKIDFGKIIEGAGEFGADLLDQIEGVFGDILKNLGITVTKFDGIATRQETTVAAARNIEPVISKLATVVEPTIVAGKGEGLLAGIADAIGKALGIGEETPATEAGGEVALYLRDEVLGRFVDERIEKKKEEIKIYVTG